MNKIQISFFSQYIFFPLLVTFSELFCPIKYVPPVSTPGRIINEIELTDAAPAPLVI